MAARDRDQALLSFRRTIGAEATNCTVTVVKGMDEYLSLLRSISEYIAAQKDAPLCEPEYLFAVRLREEI